MRFSWGRSVFSVRPNYPQSYTTFFGISTQYISKIVLMLCGRDQKTNIFIHPIFFVIKIESPIFASEMVPLIPDFRGRNNRELGEMPKLYPQL